MILGMALVGSGFVLFFANLHRRQAKKEERDIHAPGTIPTCLLALLLRPTQFIYSVLLLPGQHRIKQANSPVDDSDRPLTVRHHASRETPLTAPVREHNNRHSTIANYLASADFSEEGRRMQPTPQRSRGDGSGRVYTKSPSFSNSYEKNEKHHKRIAEGGRTRLAEDEEDAGH
jgi:hypothetical protein